VSAPEHPDERVEELLRANERLAVEVRNLSLAGSEAPRPAAMPTARRLGRQSAERDRLREERDAARAELEAARGELGAALDSARGELELVAAHRAGLERQNQELAREVARLSAGIPGLLRRLRGRLSG
jgi:chromosome segregation ATPase